MEMEITENPVPATHCYCQTSDKDQEMLKCDGCLKYFHTRCLKGGFPSNLIGDVFYHFTCDSCAPDKEEKCFRMQMKWTFTLMLVMYNLQMKGTGIGGYVHARDHLYTFIDKNWNLLFGNMRKKSTSWKGTVAGVLSAGKPNYFKSRNEKGDGWWSLANIRPPTLEEVENDLVTAASKPRPKMERSADRLNPAGIQLESRRRRGNSSLLQSAIDLKERRSTTQESRRGSTKGSSRASTSSCEGGGRTRMDAADIDAEIADACSHWSEDSSSYNMELYKDVQLPAILFSEEVDHQNDSVANDGFSNVFVKQEPIAATAAEQQFLQQIRIDLGAEMEIDQVQHSMILSEEAAEVSSEGYEASIASELMMEDENSTDNNEIISVGDDSDTNPSSENYEVHPKIPPKKQKKSKKTLLGEETQETLKIVPMSSYEERQLLRKLNYALEKYESDHPTKSAEYFQARRLRRKLIVRQIKREKSIPLFEFDQEIAKSRGVFTPKPEVKKEPMDTQLLATRDKRILDRFLKSNQGQVSSSKSNAFLTKLMGADEYAIYAPFVSPYTLRVLKPFIWRDYETVPPKLRLLQEIIAYPYRNDPTWKPKQPDPISYSYVRMEHIPAINTLCEQFFWPNIDMCESLTYPDFTCVALYKKIVIGFAFMLPDVKYNESYITFLFTHPDWRKAGIATFMIYHLIQTCMGKDITLHCSQGSNALVLYQKFGFKAEEFIRDFYDKYYPENSKESKHAVFLRLSR